MSTDYEENELEREIKIVSDFISENKYPSRKEIIKTIEKDAKRVYQFLQDGLYLILDYDEEIHLICKKIYENLNDKKIINECGKIIYDRIGFYGMQSCYYILKLYSPLAKSNNMVIRSSAIVIEYYWDGIGKWQC